jgi:condensin complex subunit 3
MLSHSSLPPLLVPTCLDVLLKVNTSEKEFMRIVVEIVQGLRADSKLVTSEEENGDDDDEDDDDEARARRKAAHKGKQARTESKEPAHLERRKELDLRCLVVVKALLERVMGVSGVGVDSVSVLPSFARV